jgi:ABC-type transporter Mla maintaining outer membrane lipid asymmetry permease subunit MlaE
MEAGITRAATAANPVVGDRELDSAGQAVYHSTLATEVAQRLFVRLLFFKGEWFLNLDEGTPYYQEILRKAPPARVVRAVFGGVILGTQGVSQLTKFAYSLSSARVLTLTFECRLTDGTVFRAADFGPFVVQV